MKSMYDQLATEISNICESLPLEGFDFPHTFGDLGITRNGFTVDGIELDSANVDRKIKFLEGYKDLLKDYAREHDRRVKAMKALIAEDRRSGPTKKKQRK